MLKLLQISRPQFLTSGFALFIFGVCWALLQGAPFSLARLLLGFLVIVPAHLSVSYSNNYFVLAFLSLLPLTMGMFALVKRPAERQTAMKLVGVIMVSLALFCILADGYLVYLAAHRGM